MAEAEAKTIQAERAEPGHIDNLIRRRTGRIEALSDGVFAVAMTLLVFDIKAPSVPVEQLPGAILALWPNFFCYVVSFALLGVYWSGQVAQFEFIRKVDQVYTWLTIGFLALVVLLPFSASLLSKNPSIVLSIAVYGANLIILGIMLFLLWARASNGHRLIDPDVPAGIVRFAKWRCLLPVGCYLVAILASLVHPLISLAIFALIPTLYILPAFQWYWLKLAG